jgi:hypothetical protein
LGRRFIVAGLTVAIGLFAGVDARADQADSSSSDVFARLRPEYDPNGMRIGTFSLYPSVSSGGGMDSNVYNAPLGVSDFFYTMNTGVELKSGWSRHELTLDAHTKSVWFASEVSENQTNWDIRADLRLDLVRGTTMSVIGDYALAHEARGMDHPGGAQPGDASAPTEFTSNDLEVQFEHSFNRLKLSFDGALTRLDFLDSMIIPTLAQPSGGVLNNDDRDRSATRFGGKASYEMWSDAALFVRGTHTSTDYVAAVDDGGVNRDSSEFVLDGGVEFAISHVLNGEIAAGSSQKTFVDPNLTAMSGANVSIKLKWYPSMLTNVTLDGGRSNEETSITGSSGIVATRGGVTIDHELLRNVILSGKFSYENDAFAETARNDDVLRGSVSGRFLLNNEFHLDAGYEFVDRTSSDLPFAYSASQFQLSLTGKM